MVNTCHMCHFQLKLGRGSKLKDGNVYCIVCVHRLADSVVITKEKQNGTSVSQEEN